MENTTLKIQTESNMRAHSTDTPTKVPKAKNLQYELALPPPPPTTKPKTVKESMGLIS